MRNTIVNRKIVSFAASLSLVGAGWGAAAAEEQSCAEAIELARPADGRLIFGFGDAAQHGAHSNGLVIEVQPGAHVRAPLAGTVIYAAQWRSYGNLVTIDAGCDVRVIVAGLGGIAVSVGERVTFGQVIGAMAYEHAAVLPVVYVELRRANRPVDPGARFR